MRLARLLVAGLALATTLVLASAGPAMACSCAGPLTDTEALASADAVFIGTVASIHAPREGMFVETHPAVVVLDVDAVYSGEIGEQVGVVTNESSAACGFDFELATEYLVFGRSETGFHTLEDGWYDVGLCSGTRELAAAEVDIDADPAPPLATGPVSDGAIQRHLGSVRPSLFPEAFIFVGVLAFVLGMIAWLNRKTRTVT